MKHEHVAVLVGHLGAPGAGDLVAHAGEAELAVERAGRLHLPVLAELAGKAAGGGQREVGRRRRRGSPRRPPARSSAHWCWSAWSPCRPCRSSRHIPWRARRIQALLRPPVAERGAELDDRLARIADDGERPVLGGVEAAGIDGDDARLRREHRPRAGGEILQPRADRDDHVRVAGQRIGRGRRRSRRSGRHCCGCSCTSDARPAIVSATGRRASRRSRSAPPRPANSARRRRR